jgi:hypothetical protein
MDVHLGTTHTAMIGTGDAHLLGHTYKYSPTLTRNKVRELRLNTWHTQTPDSQYMGTHSACKDTLFATWCASLYMLCSTSTSAHWVVICALYSCCNATRCIAIVVV